MAPKLILIPGLGVGRRLFDPQRRVFQDIMFVPDWQRPIRVDIDGKYRWESLNDYASRWSERWAQTVISTPEARASFFVGGCSFGGMVAIEAARHLIANGIKPRGVILMASARSPAGNRQRLISTGAFLSRILPEPFVKQMLVRVARWAIKREGLTDLDQVMLNKLIAAIDMEIVQFGLHAMAHWELEEKDLDEFKDAGVPIHQIHGKGDRILRPATTHRVTSVEGARHLVNVARAGEVNAWLSKILESG